VPQDWDLWYAFTKVRYYDYTINENGKLLNFGHEPADYSTDVLKERAVRFIKDQTGSAAPFFMLIATKAPHGQGEEGQKEPVIPSPPRPPMPTLSPISSSPRRRPTMRRTRATSRPWWRDRRA
jgi:hypothetical protein